MGKEKVVLKKYGSVLGTRLLGKKIFEKYFDKNFDIIFDFSGVKLINTAFADELFGKIEELGKVNFKIINIENDMIKKIIIYVMDGRKK